MSTKNKPFTIDQSSIDITVDVKVSDTETITLKGVVPTSKKIAEMNALVQSVAQKEVDAKGEDATMPAGYLNGLWLSKIYNKPAEFFTDTFTESTISGIVQFVVGSVTLAEKK